MTNSAIDISKSFDPKVQAEEEHSTQKEDIKLTHNSGKQIRGDQLNNLNIQNNTKISKYIKNQNIRIGS